ncbi:MAG: hypothetical protein JWQ19_2153 [Subtercola sp.]|nr:hypothetical protein [Subtercola sp.]
MSDSTLPPEPDEPPVTPPPPEQPPAPIYTAPTANPAAPAANTPNYGAAQTPSPQPLNQQPPAPQNPYGAPQAPAPQTPYGPPQPPAPQNPYGAPPPGAPQNPYGAPPPGAPEGRTNVLAIVSLVLGIVSYFTGFFLAIGAIITGHIALSQIKKTGGKGRGMALGGLILGYVGIVVGILVTILVIVLIIAAGATTAANDKALNDYLNSMTAIPQPSDTGFDVPTVPTGDLSFGAGQELYPTDTATFAETFALDPAWTVKTPDTGGGNWSYTSNDGQCTLKFYQGALGDSVDIASGDDLATTDSFLTYVDNATAADEAQYADSDGIAYQYVGSSDEVATRTLTGTDNDGTNWITSARAFTQLKQGMYFDLTCQPAADLTKVYTSVLAETSIVVD